MSRIGDAKYASEMIPRKIKMNPTIEAALPGSPCCIGNLPGARGVSRTSLFALVILWACDFTADGLACISNFGHFSFHFWNYFSSSESCLLIELCTRLGLGADGKGQRLFWEPQRIFG
jgi:hypothetical protein